ncbi:MAG TPA: zinc dependent phospholipase C family protein [Mobilitalea sp.]|nr:zinc dependent phospholipase C family protein [Mobilitalea sp.]
MNKGSHISLAHFLMKDINTTGFLKHKKAFLVGSILPDCLPSFLTTRHTITDTFDLLQTEIQRVCDYYYMENGLTSYYYRHLGIICHYLADYYTFPHNPGFQGSMKKHYEYEKELLTAMQQYLDSEEAENIRVSSVGLYSAEEICRYIAEKHREYLETPHDIRVDCRYITEICYTTMKVIMENSLVILPNVQGGQIEAA